MTSARSKIAPICVKMAFVVGLSALTVISGCSSISSTSEQPAAEQTATATSSLPETHIEDTLSFDEDSLYSLLTAELALTRAQYKLGLDNYVERALNSRDVNVTARATQIARILKRREESLQMAELWKELDPGNREPRFILVSEYTHTQQFEKAFDEAQVLLEAGHKAGFEDIAVEAVDNKYPNLDTLSGQYTQLLTRFGENSSLRTGLSIIHQYQKDLDKALEQIVLAEEFDPNNARVIYQHYRVLLEQEKTEEATAVYGKLVELQPTNFRIRSRYAHQLLRIDMKEAMEQYRILHEQAPQNHDVLLNLGLLQLEHKKYKDAETSFLMLIDRDQHLPISHFSLGELYKERGDMDKALQNYLAVEHGNRYVDAIASAADIYAERDGFAKALEFVSSQRQQAKEDYAEELFLVEGEVLQRKGNHIGAVQTYSEGITAFPESVTLHYSRAMLYASNEQIEKAEADFKHVLSLAPESATVLNALGYTLLVQTDRLQDAKTYIEKAYAIDPEDPAIIDSVGWLRFKQGNARSAVKYLRRALDKIYDDEIAAHLTEALWTIGKRQAARRTLVRALDRFPTSKHINDVIDRLRIRLD